MKINVDDFLKIGYQHHICEDYVISGRTRDDMPYAILSDGCSSSRNTDVGARLLCHFAKRFISKFSENTIDVTDSEEIGQWVIHNAEVAARQMGLDRTSLDATLIVTYIANGNFYSHMYGDGMLILIPKIEIDGKTDVREINYTSNAPFYLSYHIDPERFEQYRNIENNQKILTIDSGYGKEQHVFDHWRYPYTEVLPISEYDFMMIASDGLQSFVQDGERMSIVNGFMPSIVDIFNFKNTKGEFLKRRMGSKRGAIKTLENTYKLKHFDDISIAGYAISED
jgi:serine/threonine protein phosphatase PrpC